VSVSCLLQLPFFPFKHTEWDEQLIFLVQTSYYISSTHSAVVLRTMGGLAERFRKPKTPVVLGSPQKDGVVHDQWPPKSPDNTPPVLRNFSYPTSITNGTHKPLASAAEQPSAWDQLGEICNFSPDIISRTRQLRTAGLEDPFFYKTDRTPYRQLVDCDGSLDAKPATQQTTTGLALPSGQPAGGKRQRRSTLLGFSSAQVQATSWFWKNAERIASKDKVTKHPTGHSIGDHIFSQKPNIAARLKRSSFGHHKISASFDATRFLSRRSDSLERPTSSSGVPLIDTRLTHSSNSTVNPSGSPAYILENKLEEFSADIGETAVSSHGIYCPKDLKIGPIGLRDSLRGLYSTVSDTKNSSGSQRNDLPSESNERKRKDEKGHWFLQLKEWVSVSEPSTQALKAFKKETYNRAGITPDDPRAHVKPHLPVSTSPPDAIKPSGRGPEPEEAVLQRAMQRKQAQELLPVFGTSQGSQSSASHGSSSSSVTNNARV